MKRVLILGALLTAIVALPASAQPAQRALSFGLGGLTSDQTARLNVAFIPGEPTAPVQVTLRFLNASGQPVLNADGFPVEEQVQIAPGASDFLDLRGSLLGVDGSERAEIRPVVVARPRDVKHLLLSAEVFDTTTGITTAFLPGEPIIPGEPSRPLRALSFGLGGLTLDQTARLTLRLFPRIPLSPATR